MSGYDHIAAAAIFLLIVGSLIWRALDRRVDAPEQHEMLPSDWEKR